MEFYKYYTKIVNVTEHYKLKITDFIIDKIMKYIDDEGYVLGYDYLYKEYKTLSRKDIIDFLENDNEEEAHTLEVYKKNTRDYPFRAADLKDKKLEYSWHTRYEGDEYGEYSLTYDFLSSVIERVLEENKSKCEFIKVNETVREKIQEY